MGKKKSQKQRRGQKEKTSNEKSSTDVDGDGAEKDVIGVAAPEVKEGVVDDAKGSVIADAVEDGDKDNTPPNEPPEIERDATPFEEVSKTNTKDESPVAPAKEPNNSFIGFIGDISCGNEPESGEDKSSLCEVKETKPPEGESLKKVEGESDVDGENKELGNEPTIPLGEAKDVEPSNASPVDKTEGKLMVDSEKEVGKKADSGEDKSPDKVGGESVVDGEIELGNEPASGGDASSSGGGEDVEPSKTLPVVVTEEKLVVDPEKEVGNNADSGEDKQSSKAVKTDNVEGDWVVVGLGNESKSSSDEHRSPSGEVMGERASEGVSHETIQGESVTCSGKVTWTKAMRTLIKKIKARTCCGSKKAMFTDPV